MTNQQLTLIKSACLAAAGNPSFRHHKWYRKYHLEIVLEISNQLRSHYSQADQAVVEAFGVVT